MRAATSARFSLRSAQRAFEAGDFQEVRRLAGPVSHSPDADTARGALSLLGKVSADPALLAGADLVRRRFVDSGI